ncbi:MAG TPA: hypothetical protein PKY77_22005 [Phycisphaerae bacterium]|nr:hypothetical protein [Phycisphaerae bacterium]HRY71230.1 hypothetical protein [Phycisphaerae bacterium]HSA29624.1 hypothetical protein [Phycisphaerae bacterium]
MKSPDEVSPELQTLIDGLLDGLLSEEEIQQLEAFLRGCPGAQVYFRRYCQLHINLDTGTRVQRAVDAFRNRRVGTAQPAPVGVTVCSGQRLWAWAARCGRAFFQSPQVAWASCAVIVGLVGVGLYFRVFNGALQQEAGQVSTVRSSERDMIHVRLDTEETRTVGLGDKGQVIVEGPADLELIGTSRGRLQRGRVKINKTDGGGFVLETPRGVVTDLSTEFGVDVAHDLATEVIVFDGSVELAAGGKPGSVRLVRGEGVVVGAAGELDRVMSIVTYGDRLFRRASAPDEEEVPLITEVRDNIRVSESKQFYEIVAGGLGEDAFCYVDRPEDDWNGVDKRGMPAYLIGADYVKTFCGDQVRQDLKISVTLSRPAKLYVFMDDRVAPPDWLRTGFVDTGDNIGRDNGKMSPLSGMKDYVRDLGAGNSIDHRHSIWMRVVDQAGVVDLGPIWGAVDETAMYGIAAVAIEPDAPVVSVSAGVEPVDWSRFAELMGMRSEDAFGQDLIGLVQRESGHLYDLIHSTYPLEHYSYFGEAEGYRVNATGLGNSLRTLAHFAWGNAVMIRTGVFDPSLASVSQGEALRRTELAIRGVAMTHIANNNVPKYYHWGQGVRNRSWQAAYWASRGAQAAWMLWDSLSTETQQAVATMVKYEADALANDIVPYWRSRAGTSLTPGDTKAEENAWNSRIVTVAQAMMPNDPHVGLWRQKASELMISSYSRPSDVHNTTPVDGRQVSQWLNGYNTFDDGVLVNHHIVHPDYIAAHTLTYDTLVDATLAGQCIPASAFFNEQLTWDAMTKLAFVVGTNPYGTGEARPVLPPGGTVFHRRPDGRLDPTLYFPNGNNWSFNSAVDSNYVLFLIYGHVRGLDAGQSPSALDWAAAQIDALEELQNRTGHTGNLYAPGDWNGDLNTIEADAYRELAETWLVHWLHQHDKISPMGAWGAVP